MLHFSALVLPPSRSGVKCVKFTPLQVKAQLASAFLPAKRRFSCRYYNSCSETHPVLTLSCLPDPQRCPMDPQRPPTSPSRHCTGVSWGARGKEMRWRKAPPVGHLVVPRSPPRPELPPAQNATLQQDQATLDHAIHHHLARNTAGCLGAREGEERDESPAIPRMERARHKVPCPPFLPPVLPG